MKRIGQVIWTLACAATLASAAPNKKTFPADCETVWAAVKRATAPPHYNFAMFSDAEKKGIVSTGSAFTGKRTLDITLLGAGDSCTVAIGRLVPLMSFNDDKGDLFKRIEEQIRRAH